jgi:hypothetical protein
MTVGDVLNAAADLIEKPGAWTQGCFARDPKGKQTGWRMDNAACFCVSGAISRESGGSWEAWYRFDGYTRQRGFRHMAEFNDAPGRTQSEVVAALRQAAQQAASTQSGGAK